MTNSILGFLLLSFLSYEVSAYSYNPNTPPPPPPQYDGRYTNAPQFGTFNLNNRYYKLSFGSGSVSNSDLGGSDLTYESATFLPFTVGVGVEHHAIAFEAEFVAAVNDIATVDGNPDGGSVAAVGVNANVLFRAITSPFSYLYAGVGIGTLAVSVSDGNFNSASGSALSFQGLLGGEFRPSQKVGLFAEYKLMSSVFLEMEDDNLFDNYDFDYTNSSLNFGMRVYY